jgi:hypothetical protein
VLAHGFAEDNLVGVVMAEGEGRLAAGAFVANGVDIGEAGHRGFLIVLSAAYFVFLFLAAPDTSNGPVRADCENHQLGVRF